VEENGQEIMGREGGVKGMERRKRGKEDGREMGKVIKGHGGLK